MKKNNKSKSKLKNLRKPFKKNSKKPFKKKSRKNFKRSLKKKFKAGIKKAPKKKKYKNIKKKFIKRKRKKVKKTRKKLKKISKNSKFTILKIIRFSEKIKLLFSFKFNPDKYLQIFFQEISNKISSRIKNIKNIIEEEKERTKQEKIKIMHKEKIYASMKLKLEKKIALEIKEKEFKEEIKISKERKKELQKFIRIEQAEVRKEQAEKQQKFLEQIKLEKKIEQFRKREALEIKNLEKFVLSQERESYEEVQERVLKVKQKYQALRDQKIRERVEALGVKINEGDDRAILLEKERQYSLERQKIEFALESFYRSAHSLCFQINKKYIPKYLSIMRVIDRRFETGEIFIKWDDSVDEDWLILIYIKNNSPDEGIVIEDKTNPEKNVSHDFQSKEIFRASDFMVDSLTKLLDSERKKKKKN